MKRDQSSASGSARQDSGSAAPVPANLAIIAFGRGKEVSKVAPGAGFDPHIELPRSEFDKLIGDHQPGEKVGSYICRPMNGSGRRSDANAEPWSMLAVDLDLLTPDEFKELQGWCATAGLDCMLVSTHSHTAQAPKARLWIGCSRAVTADEGRVLHDAFLQRMVFPFAADPALKKPSQPIFLPRCPAERWEERFSQRYPGKLLDVDQMLQGWAVVDSAKRGQERHWGTGFRIAGGAGEYFIKHFPPRDFLKAQGYIGQGNRFIAPRSVKREPAVVIYSDNTLVSYHDPAHDPLAVDTPTGVRRRHDAFSAFCILAHGNEFASAEKAAVEWAVANGYEMPDQGMGAQPKVATLPDDRDSGTEVLLGETPPVDWIAEGFLAATGITLLAGRPKGGKSTLVYQMIFCATTGLPFLGAAIAQQVKAVVISKDDPSRTRVRRRFQTLAKMMPGASDPEVQLAFRANMLAVFYAWGRGAEAIKQFDLLLHQYPECKLIVVDAWASIKAAAGRKEGALFDADYDEVGELGKWAARKQVQLLLLIHTRKAQSNSDNPIDEVQGTSGVTAATDDYMGMRRDRKEKVTVLSMQGRNFDIEDWDLRFVGAPLSTGGGGYFVREGPKVARITSDRQQKVLDALDGKGALTQREIAQALDVHDNLVAPAIEALLERERIVLVGDSKKKRYRLPANDQQALDEMKRFDGVEGVD